MLYKTKYGLDVSVEIIRDNATDTAAVKVNAPLYINKQWIMPHSYKSSEFTDNDIMIDSDFNTALSNHYK